MVTLSDCINDEQYASLLIDNQYEDLGLFDMNFVNDSSMTLSESIDILNDYQMECTQ
jgi:hypothetical protein